MRSARPDSERTAMIDRTHALPVSHQAKILGVSRAGLYYQPVPLSESALGMMPRLDQLHLAHPFAGSRMLRDLLRLEGFSVGRKHVKTLMKRMGIEALYRQPRTTQRHRGHPVYPYLLRNLSITRSKQVWASDVSYSAPSLRRCHGGHCRSLSMCGM